MDRSSFAGLGFFSLGSLGDGARASGLDGRQVGLWPVVWRIRVQDSESSGSGSGHSGQFMVWGSFGSACHWHCCGKPLVVQSHHRPRHGDSDEGPIYHACDSSMQTSCGLYSNQRSSLQCASGHFNRYLSQKHCKPGFVLRTAADGCESLLSDFKRIRSSLSKRSQAQETCKLSDFQSDSNVYQDQITVASCSFQISFRSTSCA